MTDPKVSAIVSAYYAADFLQARIENLLQQSQIPEIIVVCQTGSAEARIAQKFLEDNVSEVAVLLTPDIPTIYDAWNKAIPYALGEYLTSANSDDRLKPRALEEMTAALDRRPSYAVVYGDQEIVSEIDGGVVGKFAWLTGGFKELLRGCFVGPMPIWRKSLHEKYGLFDPTYRIAGDYEFWLRIASKGEKFLHFSAVVGSYLQRNDSLEHREPLRTVWETARARSLYRKES